MRRTRKFNAAREVQATLTALLLICLTATAWIAPAQAQVGSWQKVMDDQFTRVSYPTAANAAGGTNVGSPDTLGTGAWADIYGGIYSVTAANVLTGTADSVDTTAWKRDILTRPSGEATQNQRIVVQFPPQAQGGSFWCGLRWQAGNTYYLFQINNFTGAGKVFRVNGGTGATAGPSTTGTINAGDTSATYQIDASVVTTGTSPNRTNTINLTITNVTAGTSTSITPYTESEGGSAQGIFGGGQPCLVIAPSTTGFAQKFSRAQVYSDSGQITGAAPGQITGLSGTPGNGVVNLSWTAPASGGTPTGTKIYRTAANGGTGTEVFLATQSGTATTYPDASVVNGSSYRYYVVATNATGDGTQSNEAGPYTPVNAASYTVTPPTRLIAGQANTFTLTQSGTTASNSTVTVSGGAGTYSSPITLPSGTNTSTTFTYTPTSGEIGTNVTFTFTNNNGLTNPTLAAQAVYGLATSYTLTGPSSGTVNAASSNFTASLPANYLVTGAVTLTPATTGTGTFTGTPTFAANTPGASTTFTYTPSSTAGSPHTISTTNNGGLSNPAGVAYTVSSGPTTVTMDDTFIVRSPYNWYLNGSGTAAYLASTNPGAYLRLRYSIPAGGDGKVVLKLDTSNLNSVSSSVNTNYPKISVSIDGGAWTDYQLPVSSTTAVLQLASGLTSGNHNLVLFFKASIQQLSSTYDRWTANANGSGVPINSVKITGIQLDTTASGGSILDPSGDPVTARRSKNAIAYGDSITEGVRAALLPGGTGNTDLTDNDAKQVWAFATAQALNAELGLVGYGRQSWNGNGTNDNVPLFPSSWNFLWSGVSRSFATVPDYAFTLQGENDYLQGSVASTVQTSVQTFIAAFRTACSTTKLFICNPMGLSASGTSQAQAIRTALSNAVTASGDASTFFLDAGAEFASGLDGAVTSNTNNTKSNDKVHPFGFVGLQYGGIIATQAQAKLGGTTTLRQRGSRPAYRGGH